MSDLIERLRAASHDERLSTGMLYREAADEIERLQHELVKAYGVTKLYEESQRELAELKARQSTHYCESCERAARCPIDSDAST